MSQTYFVLRHGERADYAETSRVTKVVGDPPLTEVGLVQAETAARMIRTWIGNDGDIAIFSSPFTRCVETAAALARMVGVDIVIEEGFSEIMSPKYFEDGILDRVLSFSERENLEMETGVRIRQGNHVLRPAFPESWGQTSKRLKTVWEEFKTRYKSYKYIIIVTHLFIVDDLFKLWTDITTYNDDGYCKLGICEISNDKAKSLYIPSSEYIFSSL